jgi:hypothetical protein
MDSAIWTSSSSGWLEPLRPTTTSPGVCNAGGDKTACFEVDKVLIKDEVAFDRHKPTLQNAVALKDPLLWSKSRLAL